MSVEPDNKHQTRYFEYAQQLFEQSSHQERASALHEDMAQLLAAMRLHLSSLRRRRSESEEFEDRLHALDGLIGNAFVLLRQIAVELSPMGAGEEGLCAAMRALIRSLSERHNINCRLVADESELEVGTSRALTIFRVAQHALEAMLDEDQALDVLIKLRGRQGSLILTIDCRRGDKSQNGRRGYASDSLEELRAQVKESGGRMRVTQIDGGERLEVSVPRYSGELQ